MSLKLCALSRRVPDSARSSPIDHDAFLERGEVCRPSAHAQRVLAEALLAGPVACDALDRARGHERRLLRSDLGFDLDE